MVLEVNVPAFVCLSWVAFVCLSWVAFVCLSNLPRSRLFFCFLFFLDGFGGGRSRICLSSQVSSGPCLQTRWGQVRGSRLGGSCCPLYEEKGLSSNGFWGMPRAEMWFRTRLLWHKLISTASYISPGGGNPSEGGGRCWSCNGVGLDCYRVTSFFFVTCAIRL